MARGPGKGKTNNPAGRPAGIPNRTTSQAKELLESILYGEIDNIAESLQEIRAKSEKDYIDACVKMFQYVLPKKSDVTSNDKEIKAQLTFIVDSPETGEILKKFNGSGQTD